MLSTTKGKNEKGRGLDESENHNEGLGLRNLHNLKNISYLFEFLF